MGLLSFVENTKAFKVVKHLVIFKFSSFLKYYFSDGDKDNLLRLELRNIALPVFIRAGSSIDKDVLRYVFYSKYHLPPAEIKFNSASVIFDLGCNIGLTLVHYANLYPDVKIIAVEMDIDNFHLAKKNTAGYKNVVIYNNAVWINNDAVSYSKESDADAYAVNKTASGENMVTVNGITINDLMLKNNIDIVDYIKMDIEGAEIAILNSEDIGWLRKIRSINLEVHGIDDKEIERYIQLLNSQGLVARKDDKHWASIIAFRK